MSGATPPQRELLEKFVGWAFGQPFNNVILLLILAAGAWGGRYFVTEAVPLHLKQIQDGYERLTKSHETERERTLQTYDKWLGILTKREQAEKERQAREAVGLRP